jgi:hypothetical protein
MKLLAALWPLGLSLLAACAATSTVGGGAVPAAQARVTGSVTYLQHVALPPVR